MNQERIDNIKDRMCAAGFAGNVLEYCEHLEGLIKELKLHYEPKVKEPRKKKWYMGGNITGGDCTLFVEADTIEEAIKLFHNGDWETENGSWECEPDVDTDDLEAIEHELSRQNK